MKQSVYLFFLLILLSFSVVNASEKISLMSLNDLNIIFSTNAPVSYTHLTLPTT